MLSNRMRTSLTSILIVGFLFHVVYIMSVFDCYFTSPVVHGMNHFVAGDGDAKRLVLIVADGLRADLLFNLKPFPSIPDSPEIVAPHLREITERRGAFGVSHTRVPTESRPGHVAIIGGMYEDVSAVTKGWKTNPVDFDSVFNQSSHTYSFGSPDILPMFAHGAIPGKVETWCYDENDEDFTRDATELDIWVLNQLEDLFKNASTNASLDAALREDKVVYFLHLLGLDTTGHSYRPHSKEYMQNIQVVDEIVKKTEQLFYNFFKDAKTSYVFTADHGMSNIGNHGDGNPDSTRTPLIAWGAGVRGPLQDTKPSSHDAYSASWGFSHLFRRDVEQADIAALMSTLLGINFPANSVGVLPDVNVEKPGYLNLSGGEGAVACASLANAKVSIGLEVGTYINTDVAVLKSILEQYRVKHGIKRSRKIFYTPYPGLANYDPHGLPGSGHILSIEQLINAEKWNEASKEAAELIQLSLDGLRYLETYDRYMLRVIVTLGYLGWSAFSATTLLVKDLADASVPPPKTAFFINAAALFIMIAFSALFAVQSEPWTYYLYVVFPCYFWRSVALRISRFRAARSSPRPQETLSEDRIVSNTQDKLYEIKTAKVVRALVLAIAALQAMVLAYKHRSIWSLGFVIIGVLWPTLWPEKVASADPYVANKWTAACLACAIFPLRNVEQGEDLRAIIAGGLAMFAAGTYAMNKIGHTGSRREHRMQLALIFLAMLVTSDSVRRLTAKQGLPLINQVLGWLILGTSVVLPLFFPFRTQPRSAKLLTLFLEFSPCFIILSICAEGIFYLTYCTTLIVWIQTESAVRLASTPQRTKPNGNTIVYTIYIQTTREEREIAREWEYKIRVDDVRIAIFFLFFVQVAFFGTGNVASISSFYLEPVYRLIPVFSPFAMGALLIFKIIAPYVMLSAAFATLSQELGMPPFTLFLIALSLTDGMTITFFLNVTDRGSWLEIGQSISFFVITSLLLLWSAGICALGAWLIRGSVPETRLKAKKL